MSTSARRGIFFLLLASHRIVAPSNLPPTTRCPNYAHLEPARPQDKKANCDPPPGLFANIVLRNITINKPAVSPGVIYGNSSVPMQNIVFDSVRIIDPPSNGAFGKDYYYCKGVQSGVAVGDTYPVPPCFANHTRTGSTL